MLIKTLKKLNSRLKRHKIYKKYGLTTKYYFSNSNYDIGDYTYGIPNVRQYDNTAKLTIGKYCSIAEDVTIVLGGNHIIKNVSCFSFYETKEYIEEWKNCNIPRSRSHGNVTIGNDVWIGKQALLLSGANIGDGAVVGAGAVIAGKIPPYSIVVGNPAKIIGYRFTPPQCEKLLIIKWWEWPEHKIKENLSLICSTNIDDFISLFYEGKQD